MPGVTVYLSMKDLVALDEQGAKSNKSRSQLLSEAYHHKCQPTKPCSKPHLEEGYIRQGKGKGSWMMWTGDRWDPFKG